jgi:predicted amidophosphoribosyltransferase
MDAKRECARCKQEYEVDDRAFVTCPDCRRPLPEDFSILSGCHCWEGIPYPNTTQGSRPDNRNLR